jgi:hypothetical protein
MNDNSHLSRAVERIYGMIVLVVSFVAILIIGPATVGTTKSGGGGKWLVLSYIIACCVAFVWRGVVRSHPIMFIYGCLVGGLVMTPLAHSTRESEYAATITCGVGILWFGVSCRLISMCYVEPYVHRTHSNKDLSKCEHCGYMLRGLDRPRCPECGTPFDLFPPEEFEFPEDLAATPADRDWPALPQSAPRDTR